MTGVRCPWRHHRPEWRVTVYKANYSAFNGYRRTRSDYSEVMCLVDYHRWRTKAAYVDQILKDHPEGSYR